MGSLDVEVGRQRHLLSPGESLVFGRDRSCQVCLDERDSGISRIAGKLSDLHGVWFVTNLSRKRVLHVADSAGFAVPLPIATRHGPPSHRMVDQARLTVLVVGELWTHALVLRPDPLPAPVSPGGESSIALENQLSTQTQLPRLTDLRREAMVAMSRGYLRPYPHYDPRPLTYQETADLLGLPKGTVAKRIEHIRQDLVEAGVMGLEKELDARRSLCEWMLAMRVITPADLDWLARRTGAAR